MSGLFRLDTLMATPTRRRRDYLALMLCEFPGPMLKRAHGTSGAELEKLLGRCARASVVSVNQSARHGGYWMIDRVVTKVGDPRGVPVLRWHQHEPLEQRLALRYARIEP